MLQLSFMLGLVPVFCSFGICSQALLHPAIIKYSKNIYMV